MFRLMAFVFVMGGLAAGSLTAKMLGLAEKDFVNTKGVVVLLLLLFFSIVVYVGGHRALRKHERVFGLGRTGWTYAPLVMFFIGIVISAFVILKP